MQTQRHEGTKATAAHGKPMPPQSRFALVSERLRVAADLIEKMRGLQPARGCFTTDGSLDDCDAATVEFALAHERFVHELVNAMLPFVRPITIGLGLQHGDVCVASLRWDGRLEAQRHEDTEGGE